MKQKKLAAITLVAATAVLGSGVSVNALPAVTSTDYTITIPATLEVANAGWNATDGITAQVKSGDTFDSSKKLTVTASSDDEFALVSGENKVGYNLATATGTYSATAEVPVWEFSAADLNADGGKTNPMGIVVEDYSNKPAGTYQDTVTFTAKVEDAAPATITVTINQSDWGDWDTPITKDGVTVSAGMIDPMDGNLMEGGTFTTTLGNFTKIEVTTGHWNASGTGWSGSMQSGTWTGTPASSVSFSGEIMGMGMGNTKFVFTIEPVD